MKVCLSFFFTKKIFLATLIGFSAIAGYVPSMMDQCISTFMDLCYIFQRNAITATAETLLQRFHELRRIFVTEGVRKSISLPHQHDLTLSDLDCLVWVSQRLALIDYGYPSHVKAVKEPWRQSSRFKALVQILWTIIRLGKLAALRRRFLQEGTLCGSTASHFASHQGHEGELTREEAAASDEDGRTFH